MNIKPMWNTISACCAFALAGGACLPRTASAALILYQDDFSGSSGSNLSGTTPDITIGSNTWTANSAFKANGGLINSGRTGAYLPFTPVTGNVYEFSVDINVTSTNWMAMGFSASNNTISDGSGWHSSVILPAWTLVSQNSGGTSFWGTTTGANNGSGHAGITTSGNSKLRLDTTVGGSWSVHWLFNNTLLRTQNLGSPTINYIALGRNDDAAGTFDNLLLVNTTAVPEPGSMALLGLGLAGLLVCRFRRRTIKARYLRW